MDHRQYAETRYVGLYDPPFRPAGGLVMRDVRFVLERPTHGRVLFAQPGPAIEILASRRREPVTVIGCMFDMAGIY